MQSLTPSATQAVAALAQRYGISVDAVQTMLAAVAAGGGTMAQFYHPELGGGGQWMQGGMTMVGDMFNTGLQATVSGLCSELSALLSSTQVYLPQASTAGGSMRGNNWWPQGLGQPSSSGGQNDCRYAYFPSACRLLIEKQGVVTYYDTLNHQIGGVQQQQGNSPGSLSFTSQFGTFTVDSLPRIEPGPNPVWDNNALASRQQAASQDAMPQGTAAQSYSSQSQGYPSQSQSQGYPSPAPSPQAQSPQDFSQPSPPPVADSPGLSATGATVSSSDVLTALEKLGQLHQQGVLSQSEFDAKKAQLLARL